MPALLSGRAVRQIERLRVDGFRTSRAVADPQLDLVLYRDGDAGEQALAPQQVVIAWGGQAARPGIGAEAALTAPVTATVRRPIAFGFDVAVGDRFVLDGMAATVTRVWRANGMIFAAADVDAGVA